MHESELTSIGHHYSLTHDFPPQAPLPLQAIATGMGASLVEGSVHRSKTRTVRAIDTLLSILHA
jgi:hypothetical protein